MTENTYLAHHGIKGVKWGVRRTPEQLGHRVVSSMQRRREAKAVEKKKRQTEKATKAFEENYARNWTKSYNKAADRQNIAIQKADEKYKDYDFRKIHDGTADRETKKAWNRYCSELGASWTKNYNRTLLEDFGEHPTMGKKWVDRAIKLVDYDVLKVDED